MRLLLCLAAILACAASSALAVTLRGQIPPHNLLREYWLAGPSGRVVAFSANLSDTPTSPTTPTRFETFIKRDGTWSLDLPEPSSAGLPVETREETDDEGNVKVVSMPAQPDTYLLKFRIRGLQFRQFRVDVRPPRREGQQAQITVRAHNPLYPISSSLYLSSPSPLPLIEPPQSMPTYFHSVQEFNALNYLWQTISSPMILIALGAWAMVSVLPKLTASLDPDGEIARGQQQALAGRINPPQVQAAGGAAGATGAQAGAGSQASKRR